MWASADPAAAVAVTPTTFAIGEYGAVGEGHSAKMDGWPLNLIRIAPFRYPRSRRRASRRAGGGNSAFSGGCSVRQRPVAGAFPNFTCSPHWLNIVACSGRGYRSVAYCSTWAGCLSRTPKSSFCGSATFAAAHTSFSSTAAWPCGGESMTTLRPRCSHGRTPKKSRIANGRC